MLIRNSDEVYKPLPIVYLTPTEFVAVALKAGIKRWRKAQADGKKRGDPDVLAVWQGCEIRTCKTRDLKYVRAFRPNEQWRRDAGIHESDLKWLEQAVRYVYEAPRVTDVELLEIERG